MAVTDRLPADRNPHQAAEWDSLGQLRYKLTTSILPFLCFCFFLLLSLSFHFLCVWLHLKIPNCNIKRERCCHTVCFPNVTFCCSSVRLNSSEFKKTKNRRKIYLMCRACRCTCLHTNRRVHGHTLQTNKIKQHQTASK